MTSILSSLTTAPGLQSLLLSWVAPTLGFFLAFGVLVWPTIAAETEVDRWVIDASRELGLPEVVLLSFVIVLTSLTIAANKRLLFEIAEGYFLPNALAQRRTRLHRLQWSVLDSEFQLTRSEKILVQRTRALHSVRRQSFCFALHRGARE